MEQHKKNQRSALLVMDIQDMTMKMFSDSTPFVKSMSIAIKTARENNMPVIYVVVAFRKGYPEMSPDNKMFTTLRSGAMLLDTEEARKVHESVAPQPDDIFIVKKRVSAFAGSDLEEVLRGQEVKHLVLAGISTSGVVLSTLRAAADKDYVMTVLSDCCADRDEEVHRVLTTKVFPRQADVMTADEWSKSFNK